MFTSTRCRLDLAGLVVVAALAFATVGDAHAATANQSDTGQTSLAGDGSSSRGGEVLSAPLVDPLSAASADVLGSVDLTRNFEGSFGSFPSFGDPQALTVDQSSGDVYVLSPSAGTVSRFTAAGAPDDFSAGADAGTNTLTGFSFDNPSAAQVAVAPAGAAGGTQGDIYVASFAGIDIYAGDGEHLGQIAEANGSGFSETCGVATDNAGRLYVGDYGGVIDRYVPSANPVTNADYDTQITGASSPCNLAADSTGAVYASTWSTGPLTKYEASDFGTSNPGTVLDASSRAVAVDPSTDEVYVDEGSAISVFDSAGSLLYSFGSSAGFGPKSAGVAVKGAGGGVYVADPNEHRVDVFGSAVVPPPTATTENASAVGHVKATLNGHLDLNNGPEVTDCHFDWGTSTAYGNTAPCSQGNDYSAAADVSATIAGLEPGEAYHFRLVVSTGTSTGTGGDQTFTTVAVPVVHKLTATFGESGSGDGQFSGNSGLAVDQASGEVYVADTANHRIEKFDANGGFLAAFGWGVKDGKAEAEVCSGGCQAGIAGSGAGQLPAPSFVAVDNSGGPSEGDVYVGDTTNNTVTKFDAGGNFISTNDGSSSGSSFGPLAGIAVDASGDLWAYDTNAEMREFGQDGSFVTKWNSGFGVTPAGIAVDSSQHLYIVRGSPVVEKLTSTGGDIGQISGQEFTGPTTGLAVDQETGEAFVDDGGETIRAYSGSCDPSTGSCENVDSFGAGELNAASGAAVDDTSGRVYISDPDSVKIFDRGTPPDVSTGTASAPSATSATLSGTVGPNGLALTDCHFEYVSDAAFLATGFTDLSSGGTAPCSPGAGSITPDLEGHTVTATVTGLDPTVVYHFRLVAANADATKNGAAALIPGVPLVETTGSPTRTATTARLDSRLDPRGAATSYYFEYGDQGPCDSNTCTSTPMQVAGSGETYELVSQQITGLKAGTTYHYRLVAENGVPNGNAYGQDATITTRSSDAPLTHGHFPGPPDSDRAWEQVNAPDTGGSQVNRVMKISDNGERVVYAIDGGSPGSQYGGGLGGHNYQYAERTAGGWLNNSLYPKRSQAPGNAWSQPLGRGDLSELYDFNSDVTKTGPVEIWRMMPGDPAQLVLSVPYEQYRGFLETSADGSRVVSVLKGSFDPAHPVGPEYENLYDVTTGVPRMIGLLPDGSVPSCSVQASSMLLVPGEASTRPENWITPDGRYAFFGAHPGSNCSGEPGLYVRDLIDSTTIQIAGSASFIRYTDGAAYFATRESLVAGYSGGSDVYRYVIDDGDIECLTCSTAAAGEVTYYGQEAPHAIAVSDDGSRIYFISNHRLLQGAATNGIYRLDVPNRALAYVAPGGSQTNAGDYSPFGNAINPDGSVFIFQSENPALSAISGAQNDGLLQDYRYDDSDRSLVCASCPPDGSAPRGRVERGLGGDSHDPNGGAVDDKGDFFFVTPTPLVSADQNTAPTGQNPNVGDDVYEWRDGQLLLVTDGQTPSIGGVAPEIVGAAPSGRDVFFTQAAQLTPDAIDAQRRLYDARIGGGFEFPQPPPPCSLEACQGTASPPPNDGTPASLSFSGPGNQANQASSSKQCNGGQCAAKSQRKKRCAKGRVLQHGKCLKKKKRQPKRAQRANHNHGGAK